MNALEFLGVAPEMTVPKIAIVTAVLLTAPETRADSNYCTTNQSSFDTVSQLEAIAENPAVKLEIFAEYARCLPKLRWGELSKKATKACETIIAGTPSHRPCLDFMAARGVSKVGSVDIEAWVDGRGLDPWKLYTNHGGPEGEMDEVYSHMVTFQLQGATGKIIETWREGIQRLPKLKKKPNPNQDPVHVWTEWRKIATIVLARLGGATEREFLKEQLAALTKEGNPGKLGELVKSAVEALEERTP